MLKLMYITNNIEIAKIADDTGVDRIFVDMEIIGKKERQGGLDTVQSHHTLDDIIKIRKIIKKSELLVRVNPIHDGSEAEVRQAIQNGADVLMLPYFKTLEEIKTFFRYVDDKAKTCLLVETPEAVALIDEILMIPDVHEIHIGLNDLHLGYHKKFMFELLTDGTVQMLCEKFKKAGITYGFGGIARLGHGALPAEYIIAEHYRMGSKMAILSRSFCNTGKEYHVSEVERLFKNEVEKIRQYEKKCSDYTEEQLKENYEVLAEKVAEIISE